MKDALEKVDCRDYQARLLAAQAASAALRTKLERRAQSAAEGAEVQAPEARGHAAPEAAQPPAPAAVCNSKVQRTADAWKAEVSRLSLALAERRRLNDCLKLEVGGLRMGYEGELMARNIRGEEASLAA